MKNEDIIRAWKDEEYRNSLSEEELAQLPENPAGIIELSDPEMESIAGGQVQLEVSSIKINCTVYCTRICNFVLTKDCFTKNNLPICQLFRSGVF